MIPGHALAVIELFPQEIKIPGNILIASHIRYNGVNYWVECGRVGMNKMSLFSIKRCSHNFPPPWCCVIIFHTFLLTH